MRGSASTRRTNGSTTGTTASSTSCCASCSRADPRCGRCFFRPARTPPAPSRASPEYVQRDIQNMADAYGRNTQQQLGNPAYMTALQTEHNEVWLNQLAQQAATPTRLAITPGQRLPGLERRQPAAPRLGGHARAARAGRVHEPLRRAASAAACSRRCRARATRTRRGACRRPYPGVVITTGSIQGSERMYWWLAQDLAERGYVVLTYDVQGQGTSETLPHENDQVNALPFCNPFAEPHDGESVRLPGRARAAGLELRLRHAGRARLLPVDAAEALPEPQRRRHAGERLQPALARCSTAARDRRTATPGRTTRVAIIGHSLGASAVSYVQGDRQARADGRRARQAARRRRRAGFPAATSSRSCPALAVQSEYGFKVQPYWLQHGSSIAPQPGPPDRGARPAARAEDRLRRAGARRASTRCSSCRAPRRTSSSPTSRFVLPASRYGQALTSVYVQRWLERYLKHRRSRPARARASATSSRSTSAGGSRSSSTARSCSASTSAPATRSGAGRRGHRGRRRLRVAPDRVARVLDLARGSLRFPALASGAAYLDGPGGSQVPQAVVDAMSGYLLGSNANLGGAFRNLARVGRGDGAGARPPLPTSPAPSRRASRSGRT